MSEVYKIMMFDSSGRQRKKKFYESKKTFDKGWMLARIYYINCIGYKYVIDDWVKIKEVNK